MTGGRPVAEKYLKAFALLAQSPNQKVLLMPYEATALLGSLAGIAEIAKGAFDTRTGGPSAPPAPPRPTGPAAGPRPVS